MRTLLSIFALLVAAVGWYYLFYSRAAERLEGVEENRANRLRGILRRTNAIIMLLMAVGSVIAALAPDVTWLFVGRIIQGISGPTVPLCLIFGLDF